MTCMNLVITGNPGVGKHTIAKYIQNHDSTFEIIDINKFSMDEGLAEKDEDNLEVDVELLKTKMKEKISSKSLIVGHLAPYVLDEPDVDLVIVLRKNPYDLFEIYKNRNYSDKKNKENTGSEILGIIANDSISSFSPNKTYEIDTTNKNPKQIVEQIHKIIEGGNDRDLVDWLSLVKEKNDFNRFFEY